MLWMKFNWMYDYISLMNRVKKRLRLCLRRKITPNEATDKLHPLHLWNTINAFSMWRECLCTVYVHQHHLSFENLKGKWINSDRVSDKNVKKLVQYQGVCTIYLTWAISALTFSFFCTIVYFPSLTELPKSFQFINHIIHIHQILIVHRWVHYICVII